MSIRSITPRTSCSEPIGISVATTWGPNAAFSESRERKKSARSRSSMFTNTSRARPSVVGAVPEPLGLDLDAHHRVDHDHRGVDDPQRRERVGDEARSPGVSIRLILRPSYSNEVTAAPIDIRAPARRPRSRGRSCRRRPAEPVDVTPASNRIASARLVLPLPRWPIRATLRIRSAGLWAIAGNICATSASSRRLPAKRERKAEHGLGVQLRDPRLGDPQHLADLARVRFS